MWYRSPVSVLIVLTSITRCYSEYTVPEPNIETFSKGFRVSIPHEDGARLFAFHGNINQPMEGLEAGEFSKDILEKCSDKWVFEDRKRKLRPGDKIFYWLYVLKDGLGYRYDDGSFTVEDTSRDMAPLTCNLNSSHTYDPCGKTHQQDWIIGSQLLDDQHNPLLDVRTSIDKDKSKRDVSSTKPSMCCELFLNITSSFINLDELYRKLQAENQILAAIAQKDEYYSRTLKLFGKYPVKYYPTPLDFVRSFVQEKLQLDDVVVREAHLIPDNGVSFKMDCLDGKVKVIMAAETRLEGSQYEIVW